MFLKPVLLATFAFTSSTLAAFGITNSGGNYIVDAVSVAKNHFGHLRYADFWEGIF